MENTGITIVFKPTFKPLTVSPHCASNNSTFFCFLFFFWFGSAGSFTGLPCSPLEIHPGTQTNYSFRHLNSNVIMHNIMRIIYISLYISNSAWKQQNIVILKFQAILCQWDFSSKNDEKKMTVKKKNVER